MQVNGSTPVYHYLDDFITVGAPESKHRYYTLHTRDCVPLGFKGTIRVVLVNTFPL